MLQDVMVDIPMQSGDRYTPIIFTDYAAIVVRVEAGDEEAVATAQDEGDCFVKDWAELEAWHDRLKSKYVFVSDLNRG